MLLALIRVGVRGMDLPVGRVLGSQVFVGMPALITKSADEYFSVLWLLSRMTSTWTPRLWALTKALAIGTLVNE